MSQLDEVALTVDELEAIRLADLEGLYQEQAAGNMKVSRQTFGRIITSAHKKVAEALVMGRALKIEGGEFQMPMLRTFQCEVCNGVWQALYDGKGQSPECPHCHGDNLGRMNIHSSLEHGNGFGRQGRSRSRKRQSATAKSPNGSVSTCLSELPDQEEKGDD